MGIEAKDTKLQKMIRTRTSFLLISKGSHDQKSRGLTLIMYLHAQFKVISDM